MSTRLSSVRRNWPLLLPVLAAVPGVVLRFSGAPLPAALAVVVLGVAVIGAAFFLSWGTELIERDIGQGLALALLALIAVLPEYAVDVVFAWKAGQDPETYAPLALANMTGANRLLIGVGWSVVVLVALTARRRRDPDASSEDTSAVRLEPVQTVEVAYLAVASLYALSFALRESLTLLDTVILFGIFALYLVRVSGAQDDDDDDDDEGGELVGPAARIAAGPTRTRRWAAIGMLVFAAAVILAVAEAFADSLVEAGTELGLSQFLLVQWVAPLASETPEFIAVLILAVKLRGAAALGALISSKINQWTLLVGIIPAVFALSSGSLGGLPIDPLQREELFLTAAQSVFAVSLVAAGALSRRGAYALLGLFVAQFVLAWTLPPDLAAIERVGLGALYLLLAAVVLVIRRRAMWVTLRDGLSGRALRQDSA
ncbi:sodium:proton exchanger [Pseudonocardia sp. KRD291]|uniref:sodium:proton exchanger n=1 Tax=Pseudonocardia sp. KRD291 TaxID=2792007 RepID=UPI001C4A10AC|nr:sodium:proton exchanger [Pseudonocardia sp. KRD291]MBW0102925.1 sodium:proton exchanger [Pseudonocardia sp. KRD291]